MSNNKKQGNLFTSQWIGLPMYFWIVIAAIMLVGIYTGKMGTDFGSTLCWLTVFGALVLALGNQLPIVKDYLGGGPLVLLILGSFIVWMGWLPKSYIDATNVFMAKINFQGFFLTLLIVGAVMTIERKTLLKSLLGYIPAIFGGLIGATILGLVIGKFFGLSIGTSLMTYILPIMGGGSAAGALPMSAIYEEVTGGNKEAYYGTAMSAVMIANILCIFFAVALDTIGKKVPSLTGDGTQIMKVVSQPEEKVDSIDIKPTTEDLTNALIIMVLCWVSAGLMSSLILPRIFGIPIHQYAYLVVVAVILNVTGVLNRTIRKSISVVYKYFVQILTPAVFAGMAISLLDFQSFIDALSLQTLMMAIFVIIGAIFGTALIGKLIGYFPIDTAMTAGLCMANMGGSGDMVVLAAGHRMGLMTYASISSRIGGAIVLAVSGFVFGFFA